jgi:hypothetical protein
MPKVLKRGSDAAQREGDSKVRVVTCNLNGHCYPLRHDDLPTAKFNVSPLD